jgi:hypothetical protein
MEYFLTARVLLVSLIVPVGAFVARDVCFERFLPVMLCGHFGDAVGPDATSCSTEGPQLFWMSSTAQLSVGNNISQTSSESEMRHVVQPMMR